jgi:hypothetical protein
MRPASMPNALLEARGDVLVRQRVDRRVYAQRHRRPQAGSPASAIDLLELLERLDVEHQDAGAQGLGDLARVLPTPA